MMGVIFILIGLPLLDAFASIIASITEVIKGKLALIITDINSQIAKINGPENEDIRVFGFQAPTEEDER